MDTTSISNNGANTVIDIPKRRSRDKKLPKVYKQSKRYIYQNGGYWTRNISYYTL